MAYWFKILLRGFCKVTNSNLLTLCSTEIILFKSFKDLYYHFFRTSRKPCICLTAFFFWLFSLIFKLISKTFGHFPRKIVFSRIDQRFLVIQGKKKCIANFISNRNNFDIRFSNCWSARKITRGFKKSNFFYNLPCI